ncbi:AMP-binding protein, partial [Acinetobacter baumannii]
MRLIDYFDRSADRDPERAFLIDETGPRSYAQVRAHTHRIANGLIAAGCKPGTKVAVFSPNLALA